MNILDAGIDGGMDEENPIRALAWRMRMYNPQLGRFVSFDRYRGKMASPVSLNKYAYADGDPVNKWDPTGQFALIDVLVVQCTLTIVLAILFMEYRYVNGLPLIPASPLNRVRTASDRRISVSGLVVVDDWGAGGTSKGNCLRWALCSPTNDSSRTKLDMNLPYRAATSTTPTQPATGTPGTKEEMLDRMVLKFGAQRNPEGVIDPMVNGDDYLIACYLGYRNGDILPREIHFARQDPDGSWSEVLGSTYPQTGLKNYEVLKDRTLNIELEGFSTAQDITYVYCGVVRYPKNKAPVEP